MPTLLELLVIASGLTSTTYGFGEHNCGDIGRPRICATGAITASGVPFVISVPQAAIAAPTKMRLGASVVWLRLGDDQHGPCHPVALVDKMNPRYIGVRGFDLNPAAQSLLTGKPATRHWSGRVHVCSVPYSLVSE